MLRRTATRLPVCLRDLHILAEQWEHAAWSQLCYAKADPEKYELYVKKTQEIWIEMEHTRKVLEEQVKNVKEGKEIDRSVFMC